MGQQLICINPHNGNAVADVDLLAAISIILTQSTEYNSLKLKFFLFGFTAALCVWIVFFPRQDYLAIVSGMLFFPFAVLLSLFMPQLFVLKDVKSVDRRSNLAFASFFVIFCVAVRVLTDMEITNYGLFVLLLVPATTLVFIVVWALPHKIDIDTIAITAIFYSIAFVPLLNELGSAKTEVITSGPLVRKYHSTSRPPGRYLVTQDRKEKLQIRVGKSTYEGYQKGDLVCIKVRVGWLGLESLSLVHCPS
ncbi:hypothetical protein M2404_001718 [Rheinheimera pacifica]|uniref:hypothetical protein n=1 Tax=Rheinheimera pacifica TaxID=173990 RepID=UPI00216890CA|nr:hypothetical protein [Rheinheimera pacifica]MCS4307391.1 hypothetical protein [Rheinheimera pacifica]